ncbi:cell division protein SepF [Streptomyces sp. NPDC020817]|uniref:cell division protein SepF n=1 Tax=Streptomyces sp. NPDC020817 TaxID=3365095 RepID=UPI0037AC1D9D
MVSKSDQAESDHVTLTPVSYADAHAVGETFRDGVPVLMNLTSMETMDAKRTIDFTAGLVFGLRGTIERVATRAFLLSPAQAAVANDQDSERSQNGLLPDRPGAHQAAAGLGRRGP